MIFLTSYQLPVKGDEPYPIILWNLHNNVNSFICTVFGVSPCIMYMYVARQHITSIIQFPKLCESVTCCHSHSQNVHIDEAM